MLTKDENRLITLKGFGEKTQQSVKQSIEFAFASGNKFHYADIEKPVLALTDGIRAATGLQASVTGQLLRRSEIIDKAGRARSGRPLKPPGSL